MLCIPHGDERVKFFREKKKDKEKRPDKYRKNKNNAVYYIVRFLTVLMAMFTVLVCSVTFVDSHYMKL